MAKIKVHPHPGGLSELLKEKGMTQVDARDKTGVDRKTLLKIERGQEVKLETLQRLATKLQVPEAYFAHPVASVDADVSDDPSKLEPGTIMLRKLDAARLEKLLSGANRLRWLLKARTDDAARKFLEEFEKTVSSFWNEVVDCPFGPPPSADLPSLKSQLGRHKTTDDMVASLERLSEHRLALFGAGYLFWDFSIEEAGLPDSNYTKESYTSWDTALLSIEPLGSTQSRRERIHQGALPPKFAPDIETAVYVNGLQLPSLQEL